MDMSTDRLALQIERLERLNAHLTFRIFRLSKLLEAEGSNRLTGSGINLTSYRMMMIVNIFEKITISDLSRLMVVDRAQISRAATDLIQRGYLEASSDRKSKRKKLLSLTDWGRGEFEKLLALFDKRQSDIEGLLSEPEMASLWTSIEKMSDYLTEEIQSAK
ncbi:MAG: MarR family transcriptional regulator [Pseudomonadota bacterium]